VSQATTERFELCYNAVVDRKKEMTMFRYVGYDPNGVKRVYGEGQSEQTACHSCKEAAMDYVSRRRDTGPLDRWTFKDDSENVAFYP
jgi:hypothetical protein